MLEARGIFGTAFARLSVRGQRAPSRSVVCRSSRLGRLSAAAGKLRSLRTLGGSVAEWLACWTQAQKGSGSNRSRDAVG